MVTADLDQRVRREVEELHQFLVDWFSGAVPDRDDIFQDRLLRRFDPGFRLIPPDGAELGLAALTGGLRRGHGSNPRFRIAIRDVRIRADCGSHVLATYVEWQRHARASTPPDNARLATVLFSVGQSLQWVHLHETWLPKAVMERGPYDF